MHACRPRPPPPADATPRSRSDHAPFAGRLDAASNCPPNTGDSMPRQRPIRLTIAAAAAAAALAAVPVAHASSITYAKGNDIWISTPDGSKQVQVTGGGTAYAEPSQADDGTIVALGDDNAIYRISQSGTVLSGPVLTWLKYYGGQGFSGPYAAKVSPDGSKVAFTFFHTQLVSDGGSGFPELGTSYSYSDRTT